MKRRDFLLDAARLAALTAVVPNDWRVTFRPRFADDPFSLGVACGDPTPNSAIIWTRLAPRPLDPDGGMGGARVGVNWQVADDEQFTKIVKNGRATAAPELSFSIHVEVTGLEPDRWYFYRFTSGEGTSPIGRLRTTPAAGTLTPLSFAVVSCNHWETGYYTAYKHLANEKIDLVTHLGDYIYEYGPSTNPNIPRKHASTEVRTLDQYRARYAQYKSDPNFQAAHARCPWEIVWDDHEVDNNYAGLAGENEMESVEQMRARRAAAYQAWWEHQPVRVPRATDWADLKITRSLEWGALAKFWMLDTRQYRANQACDDGIKKVPCGDWDDPKRQFMGAEEEKWLEQGLKSSHKTQWQVIGNQTMAATIDSAVGPDRNISMDSWSGYPAAQKRFIDMMGKHAPNRSVVITGDNHANWVNELRNEAGTTVATEFLGTSITSGGDGSDRSPFFNDAVAAENTHVRWQNNRRGYFVCDMTGDTCRTEFRTVAFVSKPDAPVETPTKWRLTRGKAGVEKE